MKRWLQCGILAALVCLSGCGKTAPTDENFLAQASGISAAETLLTVDGREVPAQRYFYWLAYNCDYLQEHWTEPGQTPDWEQDYDGRTLGQYAREAALRTTVLYAEIEIWAERYGCTVTEEDRAAMAQAWSATAETAGGEEALLTQLAQQGADRDFADALSEDYYLYSHLYELFCTAGSALAPSDAELSSYAANSGLITVEKQTFPDEAAASKAAETMKTAPQPADAFSALGGTVETVSFVPGDGTVSTELEQAAKSLSPGGWSAPVSGADGVWMLLRTEVAADAVSAGCFDQKLQAAAEDAKVEFTAAYDKVRVPDFYKKLTQVRTAK